MATYFGIDFGTTNCAVHAITAIGDGIDDEFDIGEAVAFFRCNPQRNRGSGYGA